MPSLNRTPRCLDPVVRLTLVGPGCLDPVGRPDPRGGPSRTRRYRGKRLSAGSRGGGGGRTLSRSSIPSIRVSGNRGASFTSRPPKPQPTSAKRTAGEGPLAEGPPGAEGVAAAAPVSGGAEPEVGKKAGKWTSHLTWAGLKGLQHRPQGMRRRPQASSSRRQVAERQIGLRMLEYRLLAQYWRAVGGGTPGLGAAGHLTLGSGSR